MTLLSTLLVIAAGLSLAVMVVLLTVAAHSARESRSTIFPIVREEELSRMRRARVGSVFSGVVAAVLAGAFFAAGQLPQAASMVARVDQPAAEAETAPVADIEATESVEVTTSKKQPVASVATEIASEEDPTGETESVAVVLPPTATATEIVLSPTPTPTTLPSPVSTATPVPPTATPPGTPEPAPESAGLGPISFTAEVDDRRRPVDPSEAFTEGVTRIYAAFPYAGMENGLTWTQVWYFNGQEFARDESSWEWGQTDRSYIYMKPVGAGEYRLDLFVNDELMSSAEFTVVGPSAIGGPDETETP